MVLLGEVEAQGGVPTHAFLADIPGGRITM